MAKKKSMLTCSECGKTQPLPAEEMMKVFCLDHAAPVRMMEEQ